jgi:serine/threonine protein kinase
MAPSAGEIDLGASLGFILLRINHQSVLDAHGLDIDDAQRYSLLREVASGLTLPHKHGVCVGDISPKNLLFSLTPHEAVHFIDCDAMRINGVSALPPANAPNSSRTVRWGAFAIWCVVALAVVTLIVLLAALLHAASPQPTTNLHSLRPTSTYTSVFDLEWPALAAAATRRPTIVPMHPT